jgi:hypothetical protein
MTIQYGIVLPVLIGGFLIWRSPAVSRLMQAVPQQWVVTVQLYRVLGVIFLVLYASNKLPALFAWPAGAGYITIGLLAPIVALAYVRDPQRHSRTVLLWNLFGITDLIVAIGMGFLTSPSPLQVFAFDHPNELISAFPLVSEPTLCSAVCGTVARHFINQTSPSDCPHRRRLGAAPNRIWRVIGHEGRQLA